MEDLRRSRRRPGKEVVLEQDNRDNPIDVNDEASDDDFVDNAGSTSYASGLRRSGRNMDKEVSGADHGKSVASGSKGNNEKQGTKRSMESNAKMGGGKKQKKNNKKTVKPSNNISSRMLQTRSSPRTLCNALQQLKPNQKACLEEIGFGGMVDFKVDGIPGKLGLYVVHKFDETKMEIKLEKGSLVITKDMIGEMLGLKNEGVDILDCTKTRDAEMVRIWMQQYDDPKDIKPADVKLRIRKSDKADLNFKLNIIVLFTTIMGIITHRGVCDLSILDYITPHTKLETINWCEFVWRSLKMCKKGWQYGKKDSFFRGPLTLLTMIYVDSTKSPSKIVCRKRPPTKVWTAELLSEREAEEINCGGFGHGELEEDFVVEEAEPMPNNIEGCLWMLNKHIDNIANERNGFENLLAAAKKMFPENVNLSGLAEKYMNCLKHAAGDNNFGTSKQTVEDLIDVGFQDQRNNEVARGVSDSRLKEKTIGLGETLVRDTGMLSGFDRPEIMGSALTQQAFVSIADEVERSIEKSNNRSNNMETLNQWDDIPSFSLNLTQDFGVTPVMKNEKKVLTPLPISAYNPEDDVLIFHGRRVRPKSSFDRSPFNNRVADVDDPLSSEELKVSKLLFLTVSDNDDEVLFKGKSGQQSNRLQLESLGQESVENNILDTWADVRNFMEEFRNKDSPMRLYLPTYVVDKVNFSDDENRFKKFVHHVELVGGKNNALNISNKTDMVFLPVDNEGHRFLIVFDLKYGAVMVFDQKKQFKIGYRKKVKQGEKKPNMLVAEMLHVDFGKYVYMRNHFKSANMMNAKMEFGEYEWQTAFIKPYAGLFYMRIMETHKGKALPNWNLGLNTTRGMLQKQLTVLAKKYAATILLSDCNTLKDSVIAQMKKESGVLQIKG